MLLASTVELDCPHCVYEYDLQLRQSSMLLALLPALLCSVPSWYLLSSAAVIVRVRKSVRVTNVMRRRELNGGVTSGTAASLASRQARTACIAVPSKQAHSSVVLTTRCITLNRQSSCYGPTSACSHY